MGNLFDDRPIGTKTKIALVHGILIAANVLAWIWAWSVFGDRPALLGTALVAYMLGLRHALDVDHIAAIDNVVRKDARQHWYAPALTPAYVAELFEMRAILEPAALRLAAPRLPPATLKALAGNLADAMAAPEAVDGARLSALEEELHISLLGHCGNATLMDALSSYQTLLVALTFLYDAAARAPGVEPFLAEHMDVAERLSAGRAEAAVEALKSHLDGSFARAMERLERVRQVPAPGPLPYLSPL